MRRGPKKAVTVLFPLRLYEQIKIQAEKQGRTVSSYIRQVLRRYIWHAENNPEALGDDWDIK